MTYFSLRLKPNFDFRPNQWKNKVWYWIWPKTGGFCENWVSNRT